MKKYKSRYQFNLAMNKKDFDILKRLKVEYSVNISGCFKRFLKEYLERLSTTKSASIN